MPRISDSVAVLVRETITVRTAAPVHRFLARANAPLLPAAMEYVVGAKVKAELALWPRDSHTVYIDSIIVHSERP